MEDVADGFLSALHWLGLPKKVNLGGLDDSGARLAHALAQSLREAADDGEPGVPKIGALLLLDGSLARPFTSLGDAHQPLWDLVLEVTSLSGAPLPDRAAFLASMDACADDDVRLQQLTDAFKPAELGMEEWNVLMDGMVLCSLQTITRAQEYECEEALVVPVIVLNSSVDAQPDTDLLDPSAAQRVAALIVERLKQIADAEKKRVVAPAGPSPRPTDKPSPPPRR